MMRDRLMAASAPVTLFVLVLILAGCDLIPFDETASTGAQRAAELTRVASFEITGFDGSFQDREGSLQGFLPDSAGSTSGYLIGESDYFLLVWRVEQGRVIGSPDAPAVFDLVDRRGAFRWIARVAHVVDVVDAPLPVAPLLVALQHGDEYVHVEVVSRTDEDLEGNIFLTWEPLNLQGILGANAGFVSAEIFGVQFAAVADAPELVEIQLLARDGAVGGAVREYFVRWNPDPNLASPVASFQAGSRQFLLPTRSDQERARRLSYGNVVGTEGERRGFLTFADGDYRGAPLVTNAWQTDVAGVQLTEVEEWQERIQAVSSTGIIRGSSTGFTALIDTLAEPGSRRSTIDLGTLWYAGEYPLDGTGELRNLYSSVGYADTLGEPRVTVGIFRD